MPARLAASITRVPGAAWQALAVDREFYSDQPFEYSRAAVSRLCVLIGHGLPSR